MRVDLEGIKAVVRAAAEEAVPRAGASVQAELADVAIIGASFVRDAVMGALNIEEWAETEASDLEDHQDRVERYCLEQCPIGKQSAPGEEVECEDCALAPLVVHVLAAQVSRAMRGKG